MYLDELSKYKIEIMKRLCLDTKIQSLILLPESPKSGKEMMYKNIFPYAFVPDTVVNSTTFICFDLEIQRVENRTFKEDYLHHEGQIRIDAMNLIEGKSQEFYNNLMRYNIDYGDGMTSTVIGAWNNAYSALSRFNSGQINVANTLGAIWGQISGITSQIESANKAMNNLGNTSRETAKALNLSAREYKNVNNEEKTSEITRLQRLIEQVSTQRGAEPSLGYYRRKLYDLRGYASGTLSSKKGLATVDENGEEIILDKSAPGRYRLMNEGDVVFSHEATKKLWDFANSPNNFVGTGMFANSSKEKIFYNKNYNNLSSPIVNINIKGNADFETVNALKRESENIIKKAVESTFKMANKYAEIR